MKYRKLNKKLTNKQFNTIVSIFSKPNNDKSINKEDKEPSQESEKRLK